MSTAWARPIPGRSLKCSRLIEFLRLSPIAIVWLAALSTLAACASLVPATAPPQIKHTPGAYVVVNDGHFDAGYFRLDYPSDWRVAKESPADAEHLRIIFVAPDGGTVSLMQLGADASPDDQHRTLQNGVVIEVAFDPAEEAPEAFATQTRQLVSSIRS